VPLAAVLALMEKAPARHARVYIGVTAYDASGKREKYLGLTLPVGNGLAKPEQVISALKQRFNGGGR